MVEVQQVRRRHDGLEAAGGRLAHPGRSAPVHDHGVVGQVGLEHLVPGDGALAVLGEHLGGEGREAALDLRDAGQALMVVK